MDGVHDGQRAGHLAKGQLPRPATDLPHANTGHPGPAAASFLLHARASGPEEDLPHANTESWNSD